MSLRPATLADAGAIGRIAETAGLFAADLAPGLMAPALDGADDVWLIAETAGEPCGFAFARPEAMTDRVWNLLAIAVDEHARRGGRATAMLRAIEATLDARMIVIETTQLPDQQAARALYARENYEQEGRVRDFYSTGQDKITFRKVFT